jgi:hypothetical protein
VSAVLEQRGRDVGEDHPAPRSDAFERREPDQAVAPADVQQRGALEGLGMREDAVPDSLAALKQSVERVVE